MAIQIRQLLVDLTRRIFDAADRVAWAVSKELSNGADRIRSAVEAIYRADSRYSTRVLEAGVSPGHTTQLRGWDDYGSEWVFTPGHVRSRLLRNYDGKPIGVQYPSKLLDSTIGQLWSRAKYRRTDSEYRISDENDNHFKQMFGRAHAEKAPWDRPVYVDAHATPFDFALRVKTSPFTSRTVSANGADFARLNTANDYFNRALSDNRDTKSLVLVACEAGSQWSDRDKASKEFADYIHKEAGVDKDVFGATGNAWTRQLTLPAFMRPSQLGVELPGGADSTQPAWIRHTVQGEDIPIWPQNRPAGGRRAADDDS